MLVDGQRLQDLDLAWFRSQLGIVGQAGAREKEAAGEREAEGQAVRVLVRASTCKPF